MILALCLLENLDKAGLEFTFKGGTCLLLVLGIPRRLSIDIDIVVDEGTNLTDVIESVISQGVFSRFEEDKRSSKIPKRHYKFFFTSEITGKESSILLDVFIENAQYPAYEMIPLATVFVLIDEEPSLITCPPLESLLGDKLTAFAPNTTGILYGIDKELEIIKQLFDIGQLFDAASDVKLLSETFYAVASKELAYRGLDALSPTDVLTDIFETACLIGMRGYGYTENFSELQSGIKKIAGFIYSERFTIESASVCAAKAAYLSSIIRSGASNIIRFSPDINLRDLQISDPKYSKLNKIKKTSPEAFFYFYQALTTLNHSLPGHISFHLSLV
jgi:hypothetical protein